MDSIWLSPSARSTPMRERSETTVKAHLSLRPQSSGAVTTLFEAIALRGRAPVRAALSADESSTASCPTTLCRPLFAAIGDFGDLERVRAWAAAR